MLFYCGKEIKKVGFVGLGKSNLGVLAYLKRHYANLSFTLRSEKATEHLPSDFEKVVFGRDALRDICEDIVFLSPSVRRDRPELVRAMENGVILTSDAELFFARVKSDVYAITGSDGKSTTTYLTSRLLSDAYENAFATGNIGDAMTPHLDDAVNTAYAIELSSFQLSYTKPKSIRAVVTNVTENHLNWHKSFQEYIDAKKNILCGAKDRILNFDCPITREFAKDFEVFAVFSKNQDEKTLRNKVKADLYITLSDGYICASGEPLLNAKKIKARGEHNILNFMSAISLTYGKATKDAISKLAEEFGGLRHRCELVHESGGVRFYDSSIDSSPKRCAATLNSFDERVILILGGKSKGLDFSELLPTLKEKAKSIIITGECRQQIKEVLSRDASFCSFGIPFYEVSDFGDAVCFAAECAKTGDSVLLSPAATSYDRFSDFEKRGDAFTKKIKEITKRKG